ncbi:MAG: hypothetical protein Q4E53_05315 [Eubacteriales bacterium]|nr:hypothetical protein [Eubacteriales bacterium]
MRPPEINQSTKEEREEYIKEAFRCKGNCDICGNCAFLRGKSAESAYKDYIEGEKSFLDISQELR